MQSSKSRYRLACVENLLDDEEWLNIMAEEGWRLVAVNNSFMYLEKANNE